MSGHSAKGTVTPTDTAHLQAGTGRFGERRTEAPNRDRGHFTHWQPIDGLSAPASTTLARGQLGAGTLTPALANRGLQKAAFLKYLPNYWVQVLLTGKSKVVKGDTTLSVVSGYTMAGWGQVPWVPMGS